jgi:glycosyltransferase involved in cell wall biosynthesis
MESPRLLVLDQLKQHIGLKLLLVKKRKPKYLAELDHIHWAYNTIVFKSHKPNLNDVVFTGYLSCKELECLYASATALLFPSKYEGFGFSVLEAVANSCPVISSNATSIPEVAGDAAVLVSPDDVPGFSEATLKLTTYHNMHQQLSNKGLVQAQRFTWKETAERTIAAWGKMR